MNWSQLLNQVYADAIPTLGRGEVATYIPALAEVPANRFGIALVTVEGDLAAVGHAHEPFSIQSISKVFSLAMALRDGGDALWQRCGREPSGNSFNSLVQLEREHGIPRNPFINAGALVVADLLAKRRINARADLLKFMRNRVGSDRLYYDERVAASEAATGARNRALAWFIKSFGNIEGNVDEVLDLYFHQCALAMSCVELARAACFLANEGIDPFTQERVVNPLQTRRINSLMLTCGTYDAAGEVAFQVGLPAKSGVGGGILAIVPRKLALVAWSPRLDPHGNSVACLAAMRSFVERSGLTVF
ncbi:MAG: glutaminase [Lysobacterales bacterium]